MEWVGLIEQAIAYVESRITEDLTVGEIAGHVGMSPFYFQKGFTLMCGFTVSEYIRNRRLALAGYEIASTDATILDIALKYGYDTPEGFSKAFTRFHGVSPAAVRRDSAVLKSFAPLRIKLTLNGGSTMDYRMEDKACFTVIANAQTFTYEEAKTAIPQMWNRHFEEGKGEVVSGEFGINIDERMSNDTFEYLIADIYRGQAVPDGYVTKTVPAFTWAVFTVRGALPDELQKSFETVFTEWIPSMGGFEYAAGYCIEKYDDPRRYAKGTADENYTCEIWIPVKKKEGRTGKPT